MRIPAIIAAFLACQAVLHPVAGDSRDATELWIIPVSGGNAPEDDQPHPRREAFVNVAAPELAIQKPEPTPADANPESPGPSPETTAKPATTDWTIGELYVESSEATANGFVEYRLRGTLKPLGSPRRGGEISASARSASSEVTILNGQLHFLVEEGDDLDSLSRDAIRIRLRGGLSFEPSMLRWTIQSER